MGAELQHEILDRWLHLVDWRVKSAAVITTQPQMRSSLRRARVSRETRLCCARRVQLQNSATTPPRLPGGSSYGRRICSGRGGTREGQIQARRSPQGLWAKPLEVGRERIEMRLGLLPKHIELIEHWRATHGHKSASEALRHIVDAVAER
jgi:hypothetical protein